MTRLRRDGAGPRNRARRFGTTHTEFRVRPSAIDLLDTLIYHHDGPFADSSAIPTYLVSKLTREHVTVALTGDGGDEVFAGYLRFAAALAAESHAGLAGAPRGGAARLAAQAAQRASPAVAGPPIRALHAAAAGRSADRVGRRLL